MGSLGFSQVRASARFVDSGGGRVSRRYFSG